MGRLRTGERNIYKICSSCGQNRELIFFEPSSRYRSGYRSQCKKCRYDRQVLSRQESHLNNKYGITLSDYNSLLTKQNGTCAICKLPETRVVRNAPTIRGSNKPSNLPVDHDHKTGRIRGLLCTKCNLALGYFQDDVALLRSAVEYLTKDNYE